MKKKFLSILAVFAVLVSFSACQAGDMGQTPPLSEVVVSETTEVEVTTQTEKDYSDYEEFPEGWSAKRVLNMISIDGHQLSFPCTVDDILALSEDFEIEEYEKNDSEKMAYLYYKDVQVAVITYYNNHNINYVNFFKDFFQYGYLQLEGIPIQNDDEIANLLQTLIDNPLDLQQHNFIDNNLVVKLWYSKTSTSIILSWEEIK